MLAILFSVIIGLVISILIVLKIFSDLNEPYPNNIQIELVKGDLRAVVPFWLAMEIVEKNLALAAKGLNKSK